MNQAIAHQNSARTVLLQMLLVFILIGMAVYWGWDVVTKIYIENQVNVVGWAVNGGVFALFFFGLIELIKRFFGYRHQESSINRFINNIQQNDDPMRNVANTSMIAQRYLMLRKLNRQRANINQNALAATLLATESSRNSFIKFVHNVLILSGVFGTIVSLSIALLGASDLIRGVNTSEGLGTIIYGMSTALSTTMTAIMAYLVFGYFYIKLTDTQTYLISRIEEVTATTLLPHLQLNQDAVLKDYSESVHTAVELIQRFDQTQSQYALAAQGLQASLERIESLLTEHSLGPVAGDVVKSLNQLAKEQNQANHDFTNALDHVVNLLQKGFRLPADN